MRSRVNRVHVEQTLRVVALAALALWIANAARPALARREVVRGDALASALPRWTQAGGARVDSVHVQLDTVPDASSTAWLAALRRTGVGVSWAGPAIPDVALETYPATEPAGGVFVLASAPTGQGSARLSDALGPIDTMPGGGAATKSAFVRLNGVAGSLTLTSGRQPARADVAQAGAPRRVFVSAAAGWEAKFVVAALEESGWTVDALLLVAPDHDVRQGAAGGSTLDTARYAAVVLLDSAAAERTRGVEPFARAGGGVVLAGDANRARSIAGLIAWRAGKRDLAPLGTLPGDTAWRGLSRLPLDTVSGRSALALERRDGSAVVAARRYYAGRVVGVGYDQTWRWRMAGGDSGRVDQREWWSRVVASVAQRPVIPSEARDRQLAASGSAPLAALYDVLGPPSASTRALPAALSRGALANALGLLVLSALLAEWLLRRSRGAR